LGPEDAEDAEDAEDDYEDKGRLPWDESEVENGDETLPPLIEVWQKLLNPYFPEWRRNLPFISPQFRAGTYVLKVSVGKAWRRFAVQGAVDLECFAGSILNAFEFDSDHLYMFTYNTKLGIACSVHHTFMQEPPYVDEVRIGDMELEEGDKFDFIFDFGDYWRFNIKVERITEAEPPADRKPLLIDAKGAAPDQYNGA
ncbi:MAG: IS1096 element passenger TnpR family protein, partial [Verrucomicrobiota bacterium]